jgi:uncharacterized membrane protein
MSNLHFSLHECALATALAALLFAEPAAADISAPEADVDADSAVTYTYQTLDYPGAVGTIFWGMDDFGNLAGQYNMTGHPGHAMAYRNGRFESLDPGGLFGDNFSAAGGPNDFGTLFGGYADAQALQHGFLIQRSRAQTVDFPGHLNSNVDGVNVLGAMAGVYWDADGVYHGIVRWNGHDTPFDVAGARDTYPLGISATGEIVGYWDVTAATMHGFYRSANGLMFSLDVPGAGPGGTAAFAINDVGQVAGYYADAAGLIHGFIQTRGQFLTLDAPNAAATIATAMNNFGVVAGEYVDTAGKRHGFVATPTH